MTPRTSPLAPRPSSSGKREALSSPRPSPLAPRPFFHGTSAASSNPRPSPLAPRPFLNSRLAFSLVEVLVGIAVLVAGFVPVYFFMFRAEKSTLETQRSVEALLHAETLLEEIAHLPYHAIPAAEKRMSDADYKSIVPKEYRQAFAGDELPADAGFERSVEVLERDRTKRIKVLVVDRKVEAGPGGRRGETFLSTLLAR